MNDFNSYVKSGKGGNAQGGTEKGQGTDIAAMLSSLARQYEGASEEQLISAIVSEAERGRREGTLSDEDIDRFAAAVAPALNKKQQSRLMKVVAYLKRI